MYIALIMTAPLLLGWLLDILLGDPEWMPHPVKVIGSFIERLEPVLTGAFPKSATGQKIAGVFLAALVPLLSFTTTALCLMIAAKISLWACLLIETLMCYQLLATKSLIKESTRVQNVLEEKEDHGDLSRARLALSRIVGRDTKALNRSEIARATVETVAENTTDGVVAPMIYLAVGGGALGMLYKSVNTLDSMVGYKNERYRYFGTASAKLDDFMNFVPARIAALLMLISAAIMRFDLKNAAKIFKRDRFAHASPNSAQTESVCAGALGIMLGGGAYYHGTYVEKPTIGDDLRSMNEADISNANKLMLATSILSIAIFGALRFAIIYGIFLFLRGV